MKKFEIPTIEQTEIVHNGFIKIRKDSLKLSNQEHYQYESLITRSDAAVVLGITPDNSLVLTREYRHPTQKIILSCAGGYIDANEDPLESAKREFLEETGYSAENFHLLGSAYPYPGISNQKIYYAVALNAYKKKEPHLEVSEIMETTLMTSAELEQAIANGEPIDGNLCTALFFYKIQGQDSLASNENNKIDKHS
jgi:ADP-ribose pyrophosphatase